MSVPAPRQVDLPDTVMRGTITGRGIPWPRGCFPRNSSRLDERLVAGESVVIVPGIGHQVEPSSDAQFYVQFFREPDAPMVPGVEAPVSVDRSGPWVHRGCDLDTEDEIVEMVTCQYVDVGQDDVLQPYFNFGPGFIDWRAHIGPET